ncbi:MAG: DUF3618 domain-containing protein [Pseudomonadota bacterium]
MSHDRTPADIEREIEAERAGLARSLDQLQAQFSPDAVMAAATGYLRDNGGDLAATIGRQIKANPMAAALTGIGLAWLMFGSTRRDEPAVPIQRDPRLAYDDRDYASAPGTLTDPHRPGFDDRLDRASNDTEEYTMNASDGLEDAEISASPVDRAKMHASATRDRIMERSADLKARFAEGTEHMSEAARLRVIRARHAAYDAQRSFEDAVDQYGAAGRRAYDDQPLVAGLIAFGIGAAIGAALPRTAREDEMLGAYRTRALEEADRIFAEESRKLRASAEAALDKSQTGNG